MLQIPSSVLHVLQRCETSTSETFVVVLHGSGLRIVMELKDRKFSRANIAETFRALLIHTHGADDVWINEYHSACMWWCAW